MGYENRRSGVPFQKRATGVTAAWNKVELPGYSIQLTLSAYTQAMQLSFDGGVNYQNVAAGATLQLSVRVKELWIYSAVVGGTYELTVSHEGSSSL